jgi:hypothetical protein
MSAFDERLTSALADADRMVGGGCGDNSCLFVKPDGPGTNSGCYCRDLPGVMPALAGLYRAAKLALGDRMKWSDE